MVVRVTGIDTGTLGAIEWRIEAVEDVFGMNDSVLSPPPPPVEEPPLVPMPPALVLAVEVPYWELARRMSRADLATLTDTDTYVGALACAGGAGQLNWPPARRPAPWIRWPRRTTRPCSRSARRCRPPNPMRWPCR